VAATLNIAQLACFTGTLMFNGQLVHSSGWLFKSHLQGMVAYCGGNTTDRTAYFKRISPIHAYTSHTYTHACTISFL